VGDFDVVDHAAADEGDFAANARGDVDGLVGCDGSKKRSKKGSRGGELRGKLFDARTTLRSEQ